MAEQRDKLEGFHQDLLEIRERLAMAGDAPSLSELQRDLDRLIERFEQEVLGKLAETSALRRFERLQPFNTSLQRLVRQWQEIHVAMGEAAAIELISGHDLYATWLENWGNGLIEKAWSKRAEVEQESTPMHSEKRRAIVRSDLWRRSGPGSDNLILVLDLRYGANLPLSQIAELLGLSTAAIQLRINMFEGGVVEETAREAIERQVPPGWRLSAGHRRDQSDFILRRTPRQSGTPDIVLQVKQYRDDRDTAGRPRKIGNLRRVGRGPNILVIVFFEDGRIVFVPMSRVALDQEFTPETSQHLLEMAHTYGFNVLDDAIKAEMTGLSSLEGGV